MAQPHSNYFDATALRREYLIGAAFLAKYTTISRDFIWQEQNERFKRLLGRAWRMQFYRTLWGKHGVKPGDIRSLLDIEKLPVFDAKYLSAAEEDPASFGDFSGQDSYPPGLAPPLVKRYFGPRGAEIKYLVLARAAMLQGSADDVAQFRKRAQAERDEINLPSNSGYQSYSIDSAGLIAVQGHDQCGLYLMEDAQYVEIVAPSTQSALADGASGELVLTTLFKDDLCPLIRFNTHDIWSILPALSSSAASSSGASSSGLNLRRIARAGIYPSEGLVNA